MYRKISYILVALFMVMAALPALAEAKTITGNDIGKHGEFDYELWRDEGDASMTLNEGGAFECNWDKSKTNNVLFRTGKKFDSTKKHDEIGAFSLSYGCDYQPDGNSYLCVYGWSVDPLVEFYVVEAWGSWRPPGANSIGTVEVDGGTYDIYETTRTNQPSIQGTKTFQQYWSVRTDKKTSGTVSISEHFKAWEDMGMKLGNLYEVALCVEGYQSSGTANVYSHMLTFGDTTIGTESTPPDSVVADEPTDAEEPVATIEPTETKEPTETDETAEASKSTETKEPAVTDKPSDANSETGVEIYIFIAIGVLIVGAGGIFLFNKTRKK